MDKQELIMTIAKDLLVEAIRKDKILVDLRANNPKAAACAYSDAMAALTSGLKSTYDDLAQKLS